LGCIRYARDEPYLPAIRAGSTYEGKQELTYLHGISRETVGAQAICMRVLTMPPMPALSRTFTNTTRLRSTCRRVGLTPGRGQAGTSHCGRRRGSVLYPCRSAAPTGQPDRVTGFRHCCPDRSQRAGKRFAAPASGCSRLTEGVKLSVLGHRWSLRKPSGGSSANPSRRCQQETTGNAHAATVSTTSCSIRPTSQASPASIRATRGTTRLTWLGGP
jgi:hypothetical protein